MASKPKIPLPRGLSAATRKWWSSVVEGWQLEEHHLRVLELACRAWERGEAAAKVLEKDGLTYVDRFGQPKERPEVSIESRSRNDFRLLVRELDLDAGEPDRPPRISGRYTQR